MKYTLPMKELEDYNWFPTMLRNFQTDFIGFVVTKLNSYAAFVAYLKSASIPVQTMHDLCSGSGEPAIAIFRKSNCFSRLSLSDKYPKQFVTAYPNISYNQQSIDVLTMEFKANTCYTMFNAFHHFSDTEKRNIAKSMMESRSMAYFVEILEPTFPCILKVILMTTVGSILFTPFILPFSFKRLFFTYVIPVNIFSITIDGIISVLKSRSIPQYRALFADYADHIQILQLQNRLTPLTLIQIKPKL
jgi:hypothetical protein